MEGELHCHRAVAVDAFPKLSLKLCCKYAASKESQSWHRELLLLLLSLLLWLLLWLLLLLLWFYYRCSSGCNPGCYPCRKISAVKQRMIDGKMSMNYLQHLATSTVKEYSRAPCNRCPMKMMMKVLIRRVVPTPTR